MGDGKAGERYPIVVICMVMVLFTAGNLFWTNNVDQRRAEAEAKAREAVTTAERKADRRWCNLVGILNDAYNNPTTPPTSALGAAVANAIRQIYVDLGC